MTKRNFSVLAFISRALISLFLAVYAGHSSALAENCEISGHWMHWAIKPYGAPTCAMRMDALRVSGEGEVGGIVLTRRFKVPRDLVLHIAGADRNGQVNLRIRVNKGELQYFDAPAHSRTFSFVGVTHLETMIYADEAFSYTLLDSRILPASLETSRLAESARDDAPKSASSVSNLVGDENITRLAVGSDIARKLGTVSRYGDGVLADEKKSLKVRALAGPGGIFFRRNFDGPTIVTVLGKLLRGQVTLRVRAGDEGKPRYLSLKEGTASVYIQENGMFEFLVYSDGPFAYRIDGVSVAPCPKCGTDRDLRQQIEKDIPDIKKLVENEPLEAARELLDWVATRGDWTEEPTLERKIYPEVVGNPAGYTYFEIFAEDRGGVFCGGLAIFFNKVLHLFGFDSFVVDFGESRGSLTHLTTIVTQRDWFGGRKFFIFDPWLNATFRQKDGKSYYPVFEIIDALREARDPRLIVEARSLENRDWHIPITPTRKLWHQCEVLKEEADDFKVCKVPSFDVSSFLKGVATSWKSVGISPRIEGLFELFQRRIFGTAYPSEQASLEAFLDDVRERGIPIGYPK